MSKAIYTECNHIKRPVFHNTETPEVVKQIGNVYRVLPLYEKSVYAHNYITQYSLETNEFLKCRWLSYKRNIESRKYTPFQFVDIRDFHFHNERNCFKPEQSVHRKIDYRYKLKVGPGVDFRGQMPIPQDLYMKRGLQNKEKKKQGDKELRMKKQQKQHQR